LISDETFLYLRYIFLYTCNPIVILFGLGSNIVNIIVFTKMGLKDGVTVSLFSLTISDFAFLLISAIITSTNIVINFPQVAPQTINLPDVAYASFWYSMVFYDTSMLIRVYTAVARACCVAIPLTFRNTFTKSVTVYSVGGVFSAALVTRVPMLACQGFQSVFDGKTNITKSVLYFTSLRPAAFAVNDIVNRNIITWGAISLVLTSLFVLNNGKFLHKLKISLSSSGNSNSFLVGRDLQVLRVVIIVSIIFIVCTSPQAVSGVVRRLVPDYNTGGRYGDVFLVTSIIFDIGSYLNSSLNFFVYYNFNTKFRQVSRRLLIISKTGED
ncbi:unnamed protein product, partial [Lymnaea stagnalis]